MTIEDLTRELESHRYQFARTLNRNPHCYTLKKTWGQPSVFNSCVEAIREHARREMFGSREFLSFYDERGKYKYWTMGNPVEETTLINRKTLEPDVYIRCQTSDDDLRKTVDAINKRWNVNRLSVIDAGCTQSGVLKWWMPTTYIGVDPDPPAVKAMMATRPHLSPGLMTCRIGEYKWHGSANLLVALHGVASCFERWELERIPQQADDWFVSFSADAGSEYTALPGNVITIGRQVIVTSK